MLSRCRGISTLSKPAATVLFDIFPVSNSRPGVQKRMSTNTDAESSQSSSQSASSNSISPPSSSAWDEIFQAENSPNSLSKSSVHNADEFKTIRRQTITERESKIITDMLDMIFNKRRPTGDPAAQLPPTSSENEAGVGGGHIDDLVGRLRRHSRPLRWAKEPTADLLDQKKEQMMICNSDQELLEWAQREVFDESKRYEEAARKAIEEASSSAPGIVKELPRLQSPVYPQIIAHLMRTFRDHYRDPNLALFIFHHAQKLSIVSYVFGCSTETYNELIQTRWICFRDLQGVYNAIDEMMLNGVPLNSTTRKLIENMRRDIGSVELRPDASEEGHRIIWSLLSRIERLAASQLQAKAQGTKLWDRWKSDILNDGISEDDWSFDSWQPAESQPSPQRKKAMNTRRALSRA